MGEQMVLDFDAALTRGIPARCRGCGFRWAGRDVIHAPSLDCCACFWCGGDLVALKEDATAGWPNNEPKGPLSRRATRMRARAQAWYGAGYYDPASSILGSREGASQ